MIKTLLNLLNKQFNYIVNNYYENRKVIVLEERSFNLLNSVDTNTLYVVLHFNNGTIMLGGEIIPITFECFSSQDSLVEDLDILYKYGLYYNYNIPDLDNVFLQQVYTTPEISSNFNKDNGVFKALFTMQGTFVLGESINGVTDFKINDEEVKFSSIKFGIDNTPNSANLGDNSSRVKSMFKFGQFSLSINCISLNQEYIKLFDDIMLGKEKINKTFKITFKKYNESYTYDLKLLSCELSQSQGGVPTYTCSFVE